MGGGEEVGAIYEEDILFDGIIRPSEGGSDGAPKEAKRFCWLKRPPFVGAVDLKSILSIESKSHKDGIVPPPPPPPPPTPLPSE